MDDGLLEIATQSTDLRIPNAFLAPEVSPFKGGDIEQRQRKPNSRKLTAFTIGRAALKAPQVLVSVSVSSGTAGLHIWLLPSPSTA